MADSSRDIGTLRVKTGLAQMLKGGVIMDVVNAEQAKIAEDAGAVRRHGARARARRHPRAGRRGPHGRPDHDRGHHEAVTIPVMAKCRIGHFVEAQVLRGLGVDYIDESEVLTPADEEHHVNKRDFTVPFVCGCRNLGEALRRISRGRRDDPHQGRGRHRQRRRGRAPHARRHRRDPRLKGLRPEELFAAAKELQAPYELVKWVAEHGKLPVVNFSAGGIATPADAALMMQLGCDGVFVG